MLACLGYIVPEYYRFPGLCSPSQGLSFTDIPNGLKGAATVPLAGWLQIITFVGIIEPRAGSYAVELAFNEPVSWTSEPYHEAFARDCEAVRLRARAFLLRSSLRQG